MENKKNTALGHNPSSFNNLKNNSAGKKKGGSGYKSPEPEVYDNKNKEN